MSSSRKGSPWPWTVGCSPGKSSKPGENLASWAQKDARTPLQRRSTGKGYCMWKTATWTGYGHTGVTLPGYIPVVQVTRTITSIGRWWDGLIGFVLLSGLTWKWAKLLPRDEGQLWTKCEGYWKLHSIKAHVLTPDRYRRDESIAYHFLMNGFLSCENCLQSMA